MSAERRISDEDLDRLRHLADEGWSPNALADAFGVTVQHVRRLLRGEQRASIAGLDPDVVRAVDEFLEDADLSAADAVLAATARALAGKLDACASSSSAAAAAATPRLAAELVAVLAVLQDGAPRELDELDHLQARRASRLLALSASADFPKTDRRRVKPNE